MHLVWGQQWSGCHQLQPSDSALTCISLLIHGQRRKAGCLTCFHFNCSSLYLSFLRKTVIFIRCCFKLGYKGLWFLHRKEFLIPCAPPLVHHLPSFWTPLIEALVTSTSVGLGMLYVWRETFLFSSFLLFFFSNRIWISNGNEILCLKK